MKKLSTCLAVAVIGLFVGTTDSALAFPAGENHINGMGRWPGIKKLLHSPASQGGAAELSSENATSISSWMDEPVKWIGPNHASVRHGPDSVAKYWGTQQLPENAVSNVAKMHKIQDVAYNMKPVDGWPITPNRQKEARQLLQEINRSGKLPDNLPKWVDNSGLQLKSNTGASTGTASNKGNQAAAKSAVSIKGAAKFAGGYFVVLTAIDSAQVLRGSANPNDLPVKVGHNAGKAVAAGTLYYSVGALALSNPGTGTVFLVGAGAIIVTETGYAYVKPIFERKKRAYRAYNARLPEKMRGMSPAERIEEDSPMDEFGKSYGPGRNSHKGPLSRYGQ